MRQLVGQLGPGGRVTRRRLLAAVALLGALVGCAIHTQAPGRAHHVVIISIDGLRPEFYLDDSWAAPELRALLKAGSHARAAEGVFPTVTYPNHATIVTGGLEDIRARVQAHLDAGADHVCVQLLGEEESDVCLPAIRELAPALL